MSLALLGHYDLVTPNTDALEQMEDIYSDSNTKFIFTPTP